ncbi:beta-ketoacyl-[acyl-carrier-protein] synthase family protein [Puniceicoccales bacterium CK1056]|uniref:3-oxoacyl-[acyl-carrier-protein] synthase 1 n=1 Tax=Oceanipulchritudo coccoides TaxID=2706888 RepID=A0A6B2M4E3_9BACT|nr:beta-ketoacyl-[acyl-carrier-protein] synthase family protein [Oceanipulchritudo coccoides]NDV62510.1 beta-ketoacyl-[acyl-carrier-protein] synthase family protein [Oceanipulchritudo coccoides]
MRNVVVTGLGLVTCLGHDKEAVGKRLKELKHGCVAYQPFEADEKIPIHVAAPVPGFDTASTDPEDWTFPDDIHFRLEQLKGLSPNALYAHFALKRAIGDAGLEKGDLSNERTGLYTASSGSAAMTHFHLDRMKRFGPLRCSPLGIVASIAGTLNFNLAAAYKIRGSTCGFVSACASSGHALGFAHDEIALNRQDRMVVVGAEDFTLDTIVPFAGMRVLSVNPDPDTASRPFDKNRDGFVGTGGAVALILEEESIALRRGAPILGRFAGWGQATDGYHVAASHPDGEGLANAIRLALGQAGWDKETVDYINAHATSTLAGDISECRALKSVFGSSGGPAISSTKALTGHALSLSSIMEASFCLLAMQQGFTPGSAHITSLDPEAQGLNILRESLDSAPKRLLSNSSGFGGVNVVLAIEQP